MYGKLFAQMYDGTLGTKGPWQALVTFQQMIILADKSGVVDMTAEALARRTTIPVDIITTGLAELEQPDPDSRSSEEEGRRILRLDPDRSWGWRIVNYDHYRKIRTEEERREYHRNYARDRRAKSRRANDVTPRQQVNTESTESTNSSMVVSRKQRSSPDGEDPASTTSTPAVDKLLSRFAESDREAVLAVVAEAKRPEAAIGTLTGLLDGLGADGGRPVPPDRLATALRDMMLQGVVLSGNAIRGYLRNVKVELTAPSHPEGLYAD